MCYYTIIFYLWVIVESAIIPSILIMCFIKLSVVKRFGTMQSAFTLSIILLSVIIRSVVTTFYQVLCALFSEKF